MGTLLDLNKNASHDYVDNPYWSLFQIRVRYLLHNVYVDKNFDELRKQQEKYDKQYSYKEEVRWQEQQMKGCNTEEEKQQYLKNYMKTKGIRLGDSDLGNVTLFTILSLDDNQKNQKELKNMQYLCDKYQSEGFSVFGQFAYDIQGGMKLTNKEIAHRLNQLDLIDN